VVWERSDRLLYVIDQKVTAIRAAQRFLDLYQRLGLKDVEPSIVLNGYLPSSPITVERIEAALRQTIFARLPRDDKTCTEQEVTGQDLWQLPAATALRESLEALARRLFAASDDETAAPRSPGLVGRLLAGLGIGIKNGIA
jgi:Flp pilus assembly CpaE family ATPase